mmetsp:Transcript_48030/g.159184  ORF Transcript_48030/g.159184 Transcript_48030/m.159184 type:complete len:292 (-) Transcript_48030:302-1177(-)
MRMLRPARPIKCHMHTHMHNLVESALLYGALTTATQTIRTTKSPASQGRQPLAQHRRLGKLALGVDAREVGVLAGAALERLRDHLRERGAKGAKLRVVVERHVALAEQHLARLGVLVELEERAEVVVVVVRPPKELSRPHEGVRVARACRVCDDRGLSGRLGVEDAASVEDWVRHLGPPLHAHRREQDQPLARRAGCRLPRLEDLVVSDLVHHCRSVEARRAQARDRSLDHRAEPTRLARVEERPEHRQRDALAPARRPRLRRERRRPRAHDQALRSLQRRCERSRHVVAA